MTTQPLNHEQEQIFMKYLNIPKWLIFKYFGIKSPIVRKAIEKVVTLNDLISELHIEIIHAITKYENNRNTKLKTWIIFICRRKLIKLSRLGRKTIFTNSTFKNEGDCDAVTIRQTRTNWYDTLEIPPLEKLLTPKEQEIIKLRFHNEMTHAQIGEQLGFTKQRAHQIETIVIKKIKKHIIDWN